MPTPHQAVMVTFTTPAEDATDEEFNDWYDNQHVPELLEHVEGIVAVRRYRLGEHQPPSGGTPAPYLAIYEFDRPPGEALASLAAAQGKVTPSETLGQGDRAPVTFLYDLLSTQSSSDSPGPAAS